MVLTGNGLVRIILTDDHLQVQHKKALPLLVSQDEFVSNGYYHAVLERSYRVEPYEHLAVTGDLLHCYGNHGVSFRLPE